MPHGRGRAAVLFAALWIVTAPDGVSFSEEVSATPDQESSMIEKGKQVSLEYTLTLEDGTKVDTNVGGEPLVYEAGAGQIVPGLEEKLDGMKEGETKRVKVAPEKAYGPVNPDAYQEIEIAKIPEEARKEGTMLLARDAQGNGREVRVHEIKDESVVIDFNHPLAGKTLTFDVKIIDVH